MIDLFTPAEEARRLGVAGHGDLGVAAKKPPLYSGVRFAPFGDDAGTAPYGRALHPANAPAHRP